MERLVAWYQVGSSYVAVAALILANLVPLIGVLWFGWDVWGILIIYWLENGIYGAFNVLKMRKAEGSDESPIAAAETRRQLSTYKMNGRSPSGSSKAVLIPFFIMHYGMFWVVHGIFVLLLPVFMTDTDGASDFGTTLNPTGSFSSWCACSSATGCPTGSTSSGAANTCERPQPGRWVPHTVGWSSSTSRSSSARS
jgi:hypothetical protein